MVEAFGGADNAARYSKLQAEVVISSENTMFTINSKIIFTLLRSPVTGTSGGQPTRLQVACRVESCRKLASSVKISAQCRA
jgi:hypothetical protein